MQTIRDINANVQVIDALSPAATTGTRTGLGIDVAPGETLMFAVSVGAVTTLNDTDKMTFTVKSSDTNDESTAVALDADAYIGPRDQDGTVWARVLNLAFAAADRCYQFGVINKATGKRYFFLVETAAASPSAIVGASAILAGLREAPNV